MPFVMIANRREELEETGEGLGFSLKKAVSRVYRTTVKRPLGFTKRVAKKGGRQVKRTAKQFGSAVYRIQKEVTRKSLKYTRKIAPIVLPIAGAILAPITAGASVALAGLAVMAVKMYDARKQQAAYMKQAKKQDAYAMQAEANQARAQLDQATMQWFDQYAAQMQAAGWSRSQFAAKTPEVRLAVIEGAADGYLMSPSSSSTLTEDAIMAAASGQSTDPASLRRLARQRKLAELKAKRQARKSERQAKVAARRATRQQRIADRRDARQARIAARRGAVAAGPTPYVPVPGADQTGAEFATPANLPQAPMYAPYPEVSVPTGATAPYTSGGESFLPQSFAPEGAEAYPEEGEEGGGGGGSTALMIGLAVLGIAFAMGRRK